MATPVFIVGWRRSGTTLLGNLLARHPQVAAVLYTSGRGRGILESVYFSHLAGKYGDLKDPNNFIRFVELYAAGAYFELSGVDKQALYRLYPADYAQVFRATMEEMARARGASHWLEKSPPHVFHLEEILAHYPDALFLATRRDLLGQVGSALKMLQDMRLSDRPLGRAARAAMLLKELFSYFGAEKHLQRFARRHPEKALLVPFADLLGARGPTMEKVCRFIGVPPVDEVLQTPIAPNTAFADDRERRRALSRWESALCRGLGPLLGLLPFWFYRLLYRVKRARLGQRLPLAFFANRIEGLGWTTLYGDRDN